MTTKQVSNLKSLDMTIEKTNSIFKYQKLQNLTTLFRFIEMFVFLFMMSNFSSQLPSFVKFSSDYFKGITFMVLSPKFVFVIGNMIILILFLHSKVFENNDGNQKDDMCYEYVKNCNNNVVNCTSTLVTTTPPPNKKRICRSKSENRIRVKCEGDQSIHKELRRSVTDISKAKNDGYGDQVMEKISHVKEELSSEDFRLTVEAFIARRQKILRDEEFSPMVYIGS